MTSTPVVLLLKRTGNASDRPFLSSIQAGELALSFGADDPGLYFLDTNQEVRKIGGAHYAINAPNTSGVGNPQLSKGELWVEASGVGRPMKVWTGTTWQITGGAAGIHTGTLPAAAAVGTILYKTDNTTSPSGLYVSFAGGWAKV